MKRKTRIMLSAGFVMLLIISWIIAVSSKSAAEKQLDLMRQAADLTADDVYILAVPLLEEAAEYNTVHTQAAEEALKQVYLKLTNNMGFSRKYTQLLEKQMTRKDACAGIFNEAANYYLSISRIPDALAALKTGIGKTGDAELIALYEKSRYVYKMSRTSYDYVAPIFGSTVQVRKDGLWGLARADGTALIACEYDKISTLSAGRAIVRKNGEIYAIDSNNNRVAKLHEYASDFGNFAENRIPVLIDGQWRRATGDFLLGSNAFEQLGMYSGGYAAAKKDGKWGVVDLASNWLVPAEYDGIIQDELGRCYARDAVFVRKGNSIYMFTGGVQAEDAYEDARPFAGEGFAAVKRDGKWGFIDTAGTEMIGFVFDDALSFGQHLAAVKIDGLWGYAGIHGQVVIEPEFLEAKSFSEGTAPVLTERGWQFITLLEYK